MTDTKAKKRRSGRQKIEIKKLENIKHRQVTFSKRRAGLFKKAGELCVLCGAEVAVITFSPANKPFAFGHPSVDAVINRFHSVNPSSTETDSSQNIHHLQLQYIGPVGELELEKERLKVKSNNIGISSSGGSGFWWDDPVECSDLNELLDLMAAMEELKKNVGAKLNERIIMGSLPVATDDFFVGQSQMTECKASTGWPF